MTFFLNALSPGEALDADTAETCRVALNSLVDEMNGGKSMLWRQILTAGTVTGSTGTLGSTWAALAPGVTILGAAYSDGSQDIPLSPMTMQQYHECIAQKSQVGQPLHYVHDGAATVYFYPAPASSSVTLRTQAAASDFADLDTDYVMPKGYMSALQAMLAERMAPITLGDVPAATARAARAARLMLRTGIEPEIIGAPRRVGSILTGW
jgi:hypothetical protein